MSNQDKIHSIAMQMVEDTESFLDRRTTIDQLSYTLKARIGLLVQEGADSTWIDELRALRNEVEVVNAFHIESGRDQLTESEIRELNETLSELRSRLLD